MKVPADELRERYSRLETEQLLVILAAPKSHYTAEAREVAARILADRRFEKPTPPPPRPTARERETAGWWAAAATTALFGAHLANHMFKAVKDAGVDGDVLVRWTEAVVRSPSTYVLTIGWVLFLWRRHRV